MQLIRVCRQYCVIILTDKQGFSHMLKRAVAEAVARCIVGAADWRISAPIVRERR